MGENLWIVQLAQNTCDNLFPWNIASVTYKVVIGGMGNVYPDEHEFFHKMMKEVCEGKNKLGLSWGVEIGLGNSSIGRGL